MKIVPDLHRPTPQKSATLKSDSTLQRATPQKLTTSRSVPGFDEVVNMADFFHNKTSSACSGLSDQSLTFGKPRAFTDLLKDKDFQVSPFKPSVNDSAIKQKVRMVISRLEDDSAVPVSKSQNKTEPNALLQAVSRDSGFNDVQSDSGGSSEGAFTDVMNRRGRVTLAKEGRTPKSVSDVNTAAGAQTVNEGEEVHISFESNSSDEEIDVVTEDVQLNNDDDDDGDGGGGHDNSNNLTPKSKELSVEQTRGITKTRKRKADSQEKPETRRTDETPEIKELSVEQTGGITKTRKREVKSQEKPETKRTNEMESSYSSISSDKVHNQVRLDQYCQVFSLFLRASALLDPSPPSINGNNFHYSTKRIFNLCFAYPRKQQVFL